MNNDNQDWENDPFAGSDQFVVGRDSDLDIGGGSMKYEPPSGDLIFGSNNDIIDGDDGLTENIFAPANNENTSQAMDGGLSGLNDIDFSSPSTDA